MKKKKYFYFIILIILFKIFLLFILKNATRNSKIGNNMNSQEIVDYILNINSYKTTIDVQVNSNKNTNKYIIKQEYNTENGCVQEVLEPSNIAGTKTIYKDGNLIIENTNLSLSKIFENYKGLDNNSLDLCEFVNEYKNNDKSSFKEKDNEIILETENNNKYYKFKTLYIDKNEATPTKLIIKDDNQNTTIFIEYKEIELN